MARIRSDEYKARRRERERQRYAQDQEWREQKKQANLEWQHAHPEVVKANNARRAQAERQGQKRKRNPDTERAYHLQKNYGITVEEYDELLIQQNGVCAICQTDDPKKRFFSVDHDHQTGKVRGLVCQPCNLALGHVRDDLTVVMSMATYLMRSEHVLASPNEGVVYSIG